MKKLTLLSAILLSGLFVSCSSNDDNTITEIERLEIETGNYMIDYEIPEGLEYVELEHYFDENGNPLDQDELHRKIVMQYNEGQVYSYREARAEAIKIIKYYESFRSKRYKCPAGKTTLGYGLTGKYLKNRNTITEDQAAQELKHIYDDIYDNIHKELGYKLKENQMASLVSMAFNLGEEGLFSTTLFKLLKSGETRVTGQMKKFVYATDPKTGKKVKLNGLVKRRASEINLYNV